MQSHTGNQSVSEFSTFGGLAPTPTTAFLPISWPRFAFGEPEGPGLPSQSQWGLLFSLLLMITQVCLFVNNFTSVPF